MTRITAIFLSFAFVAIAAPVAGAAPALNGTFDLPDRPVRIALGPDGNMWATIEGGVNDFVKIAPDGTVTPYNALSVNFPIGITAGPDGNLWVTLINGVAKFSPSDPTAATLTPIAAIGGAQTITTGPDGNLWTASGTNVIKIPPATPGTITSFSVLTDARGIASGSDGRLWVADFGAGKIVSVTTSGTPSAHDVGGQPQQVASGPAGQIAYTNPLASPQNVGRLQQGGTPQLTNTPISDPFGITLGADGAYWIAQFGANNVARLTTDGQYTTLGGFPASSGPRYIAAGPGNTLWVTLETTNKVARISGVDPPATPGAGDTVAPVISELALSNKSFRVGRAATAVSASKVAVGTKIRFRLSEAATARIAIVRLLPGKRSGKKCVKPRKSLKRGKNCKRTKTVGTLQRNGMPSLNTVAFSGRIGKKALATGSYRFVVGATDAAGNTSASQSKNFRVLAKRRK